MMRILQLSHARMLLSLRSSTHCAVTRSISCLSPQVSEKRYCHRHGHISGNIRFPTYRYVSVAAAATADTSALTIAGAASPALTGFWQSLSNSTPVGYMQHVLVEIHDYSGLPWWASIMLSTVLFRTLITLPLAIYQYKIMARIERLTLEMPAIVVELKKEAAMAMKKFNWTEQHTRVVYNRSLKQQWNSLIVRDNCHPAKTLILLWGQIPLWISQSMALRNLVHMLPDPMALQTQLIYTEMTIGGFAWIPNLTEVDSSYILPVSLGLLNLSIIEVQAILRKTPATRLQRYATNAFRMLSVVMVPVACSVPSALCVYWVTSSAYGLAQNLLLVTPAVRRAVGIPHTATEVPNPYAKLWQEMKIRTGQMEVAPQENKATAPVNDGKRTKDSTIK